MALPKIKQDALDARLAVTTVPAGASWAQKARAEAMARVTEMGLPHRRDEYWRYTDPAALVAAEVAPAALFADDTAPMFNDVDRVKIVFVDGVFDAAASDDLALDGITIERLADVQGVEDHWAGALYGVLETNGQNPVARPLAALNTASATDGVVIRVSAKVEKPVNLIYLHKSETSDAVLHHVIKVEDGAVFTLLENGPGAARFSSVTEVEVGEGAEFHHVRAQGRDHERRALTHTFARIAAEGVFKSLTMTANGRLVRNECIMEIVGDNASAHVAGIAMGDGAEFLQDDTVFITHDAVGCESRQVFKKVLRNGATGVFQGKILVKPGAQKTDGYQISQSLLLDDDAVFLAKPELEIYADDVQCSHGSTSGAIDDTALFYLRSRGVPLAQAQNLLVLAFVAEALDEIADERLADDLRGRLEGWLARRQG